LARRADPFYREMRKWYEDEVQSVERAEGTRIARVRFACHGKNLYPDATFTLRMSYGQPASYDAGKTRVPHKTTFGGLYSRADGFDNTPPFRLPKRVLAAKAKVRLGTPLNFVTTHDIIGGNSGSPVIDRKARLVGLIFDGNIQSLAGRYAYSRENSRAVSVHSAGILEALRAIYGAKALLRELAGQRASSRGRRRAGGA
ncbi:MAG: S46 family peptidase, partial [Elusimicrobiota bacterium]